MKYEKYKILFILQEAYWYLIDFYPQYKYLKFKKFLNKVKKLFSLENLITEKLCSEFDKYKSKISVFGGILISSDGKYVLAIKSFSLIKKYMFPKGKLENNETGYECMKRELNEEIGYKIKEDDEAYCISMYNNKHSYFIIPNVDFNYNFKTNTRNEVSQIRWIEISVLKESQHEGDDEYSHIRGVFNSARYIIDDIISN